MKASKEMGWGIPANHNNKFNAKDGAYGSEFPSHTFKADNAHADDHRGAWRTLQARHEELEIPRRTVLSAFCQPGPTAGATHSLAKLLRGGVSPHRVPSCLSCRGSIY